jgi:group I intron endonuclease
MIGIYKITNPAGEIYIGQSVNIKRRWNDYRLYLAKSQRKLNYSFVTYGYQNHIFEIVQICEKDLLNKLECYYIEKYNACDQLNCDPNNKVYRTKQQTINDKLKAIKQRQQREAEHSRINEIKDQKNKAWIERYKRSQAKKQAIANRKIEMAKIKQSKRMPWDIWRF